MGKFMHDKYNYRFDVDAIVSSFGGVGETAKILQSMSADIKAKSVQKWRERGNIPADALASLSIHAMRHGKSFSLEGFIKESKGDGH